MHFFKEIWACNLCKKKHDILVKTGQWYHGGMAKPVGLDVDTGSDSSSVKMESSPLQEKKSQVSSEGRLRSRPSIARQESLQSNLSPSISANLHAKELRRQYSLTDAKRQKEDRSRPSSADLRPSSADLRPSGRDAKMADTDSRDRDLDITRGEKFSSVMRQQHNSKDAGHEYMDRRSDNLPIEGRHTTREQGGKGRSHDWTSTREQPDREDRRRGTNRNR